MKPNSIAVGNIKQLELPFKIAFKPMPKAMAYTVADLLTKMTGDACFAKRGYQHLYTIERSTGTRDVAA